MKLTFRSKHLISLLAIGLIVGMMIAPASATVTLYIDEENTGTAQMYINTAVDSGFVVVVPGVTGYYFCAAAFNLYNYTMPLLGNIHAVIMDDKTGNGTRIENSTSYDVSTLDWNEGGQGTQWFNFTFANTTALVTGTTYYVGLVSEGLNNAIMVCGGSSNGAFYYKDNYADDWADTYSSEPMRRIYVTDENGTGGALPDLPSAGTDWDITIDSFVDFMVPLIVVLLPFALLALITKRVDKWVLLIGITIGAGLGYYFGLVPLWLVFLVTIGLIGMTYQSVRGGG